MPQPIQNAVLGIFSVFGRVPIAIIPVSLLVGGVLLFAAVMMIPRDHEKAALFGFSTSGVTGTCPALFFAVLLCHIEVRSMFAGSRLVYIE